MFGLGPSELVIVGIVAILLFGKNLPAHAAKFAKMYREFRRGLTDIQSQIDFTGELTGDAPSKPKPKKTYSDYDDWHNLVYKMASGGGSGGNQSSTPRIAVCDNPAPRP